MDGRHGAFLVIGALRPKSGDDEATRARMGFRDILLGVFSSAGSWERFLLGRITRFSFSLMVAGVLDLLFGALRNTKEVRRPFTEEALIEPMAQGTLPFSDGALRLALADPTENDFLTFISQLLCGHAGKV